MIRRLLMRPARPQFAETRPMSRDKADMLMLLVACILVLAPHAFHLPAWVSAASISLLLWRCWITFRGNRLPPRWLLLPLAIGAMAAVYATHKTFVGRDAGVTMLALLLTFKLLEMHARRDLFVIIFLSFFLMLTTFFYSQTIGTALLMGAAIIAILTAQLSFQYTSAAPPLAHRLWMGAKIFLFATPLTIVFFFLFPRIEGPLWRMPGDANVGRTGMSETMSPGNIARLAMSDDVAFRVKFTGTPPPKAQRYWRAAVMGNFDGRTWSPLQKIPAQRHPLTIQRRGTPVQYQVTMEPSSQRWLFALEAPQGAPELKDNIAVLTHDMQLLTRRPITERLRYEVTSHTDFTLQPKESPVSLLDWLDLPVGFNPSTHYYAARLRNQTNDNMVLINTVLALFREQNFRYTLEPPLLGRDSVDDFLFNTRAGFCEHFASAFVVVMRALDIPARVVTGYQGGELNPVDGFMTVRQSDAHAWAEVWLDKQGWVRVDPTAAVAPERIEMNLESALPRRLLGGLFSLNADSNGLFSGLRALRQNWDAVTNAWNQWILNYTPDKQKSFLRSLGFDDVDWRTMTMLLLITASLVMAAVAIPLLMVRQAIDPVELLYRNFCTRLARRGIAREDHEGPGAYRRRLIADDSPLTPQGKAAASQFLQLVEAARYGRAAGAGSASSTKQSRGTLVSTLKLLIPQCR
jgi:transglutaminase-like putative cysteine protease